MPNKKRLTRSDMCVISLFHLEARVLISFCSQLKYDSAFHPYFTLERSFFTLESSFFTLESSFFMLEKNMRQRSGGVKEKRKSGRPRRR